MPTTHRSDLFATARQSDCQTNDYQPTNFGGGKTHAQLALYHLLTAPEAALAVPRVVNLRATAVGVVWPTVNMPAPTLPPQALVMPEQLFLAPVLASAETPASKFLTLS